MRKIIWICVVCYLSAAVSIRARAQTLNFLTATPAYPDKALTHTYTNVGNPKIDVAINISGNASFGNNTPRAAGTGLTNQPNFADKTSVETYTFSFSKPVQNLTFNITNIDQGNTPGASTFYQNQLTISALSETNSALTPSISSSQYYTVSGNVITATATNNATASISFSGFVTTLTIAFGNGPAAGANPSAQGFTIGTLNWSGVLPVTLTQFTAKPVGKQVQLAWETTAERDASHFVVERSRDLGEYVPVGEVAARGTTNQRQQYSLLDEQPLMGANYYRLKQVDRDGTTTYSKPVSAVLDDSSPSLELLGNPADGQTIRAATRNLFGATYRLTTSAGAAVPFDHQLGPDGTLTLTLHGALPPGLYFLRAQSGNVRLVRKVMVR